LVPYYRQDLSGEAWVPIICNNGDCRFHREIPLEDFSRDDLQMCPQCGEKDVQPDEARMRELQPDGSEGRLLCLGGGREATAADCGTRMIVPASRMGNVGEIDIALVFDLPADEQTALEEFARMAPFADAVVGSLRFAPATSVLSGDTGFVLAVKTFALLIVWCVFDYLRLRWADPATNAVFAGILGSISMDIVTACACREPRTEAVIWGMRWGWKLRVLPMPTYGRLLDRVWNTFIGSLASLMATATAGLVTVGWLAIGVGLWRHEFSLWYWGLAGAITLAAGRSARNIRPAVRQAQYYGRDRDQTPDHRRRET
jgi:hypothetical protein